MGPTDRRHPATVILPLAIVVAVAAVQLGLQVVEDRSLGLHRGLLVHGRASQLDLLPQLPDAARSRVLAEISREVERGSRQAGPPISPLLPAVIESCQGSDGATACLRAIAPLDRLNEKMQRSVVVQTARWRWGLLVGLLLLCAGLGLRLVRRAGGRALGLALLGCILVCSGAVWRLWQGSQQSKKMTQAYLQDRDVTRGRLALMLPAAGREPELRRLARRLESYAFIPRELRHELGRAVDSCGRSPRRCAEVAIALSRIHALDPVGRGPGRVNRWASRWLLWLGAVFLLLVPVAEAIQPGRQAGGARH